jgi:hypothetical protein
VTGSGTTYNVGVSGMTTSGTVIANIIAGVAHDAAGNANTAATFTDNTVTYDASAFTVAINQAAAQLDPTNTATINFTVTFNKATTDFATGDVTLGGTAGATTATVTGTGTTYNVAVSGMTVNGTVIASLAAGVAHDAANNANADSTSTDNTVTYDITAPTVGMSSSAPDPTGISPIPITVTFSKAVADFTLGDITATNGTTGDLSGSGTTYTFGLYPSLQGTVSADIAAGVAHDAAGNGNTAASKFSRTYDNARPTVSMISSSTLLTNISPITVTVTFNKAVTGFDSTDITATHGTVSNFSGAGASYSFDLIPTQQGIVSADIAESVAQDGAGNWNTAAATFTRTYDSIGPIFSAVRPEAGDFIISVTSFSEVKYTLDETINSGSIVMTRTDGVVDAGSPHTCTLKGTALNSGVHSSMDLSDTTNVCTTAQSLVSGTVYTFTFSGIDLAGNTGTQIITGITFDNTIPTLAWIQPVAGGGTFNVFNQPIQLAVNASDNVGINRVVLSRWWPPPYSPDNKGEGGSDIEIGRLTTSPFSLTFDATVLIPGYNEIDAFAYDSAGNQSKYSYIWLIHTNAYKIFLPLITR